MNGYPKTLKALQAQEDRSWGIADALAEEIATSAGRVLHGEWPRCQEWLAQQSCPFVVTITYLSKLREVSLTFPSSEDRTAKVPFRLYMEAAEQTATPKQRQAWLTKAEKEGYTLREFSKIITGTEWSDTTQQKVAAAIRDDPELVTKALQAQPEQGQKIVAQTIRQEPTFANAVVEDPKAHIEIIRASSRHVPTPTPVAPRPSLPEAFARLLTLLHLDALLVEAEAMENVVMKEFTGDYVWRPKEREKVLSTLDKVAEKITNTRTLLTASDDLDAELRSL